MTAWRAKWIHDGLADLEREILAMGFLRFEDAAKHMATVVRFTVGSYQRIADKVLEAIGAGGSIAEAIPELEDDDRDLCGIAIREHKEDRTDWDHLDKLVTAHAALAAVVREEVARAA